MAAPGVWCVGLAVERRCVHSRLGSWVGAHVEPAAAAAASSLPWQTWRQQRAPTETNTTLISATQISLVLDTAILGETSTPG